MVQYAAILDIPSSKGRSVGERTTTVSDAMFASPAVCGLSYYMVIGIGGFLRRRFSSGDGNGDCVGGEDEGEGCGCFVGHGVLRLRGMMLLYKCPLPQHQASVGFQEIVGGWPMSAWSPRVTSTDGAEDHNLTTHSVSGGNRAAVC